MMGKGTSKEALVVILGSVLFLISLYLADSRAVQLTLVAAVAVLVPIFLAERRRQSESDM